MAGQQGTAPLSVELIAKLLIMGDIIVNDAIHADSRWDAVSSMMLMNHNIYVQAAPSKTPAAFSDAISQEKPASPATASRTSTTSSGPSTQRPEHASVS